MKTTKDLCNHSVDLITAARGWIEMGEKAKAQALLKDAIGVVQEACLRFDTLMEDAEHHQPLPKFESGEES